jgi:hypothetical protein
MVGLPMPEFTKSYVAFMRECKQAFDDLGQMIDGGRVSPGNKCTVKITIPAEVVDQIRFERLATLVEASDG